MAQTAPPAAPPPAAEAAPVEMKTTRPKVYRKAATTQDRSHGAPLDYTFKELVSLDELADEEPNHGKKVEPKSMNHSLLLGNNRLESISTLYDMSENLMDTPDQLEWLDVAHNNLTSVEEVILKFPNISVLYLHGNNISSLNEVDKLKKLPNLRKLSLHGNPIEELPNYRMHVSTAIPHLRMLDFINLTKVDRDKAVTWKTLAQQKRAQALNGGKPPSKNKPAF